MPLYPPPSRGWCGIAQPCYCRVCVDGAARQHALLHGPHQKGPPASVHAPRMSACTLRVPHSTQHTAHLHHKSNTLASHRAGLVCQHCVHLHHLAANGAVHVAGGLQGRQYNTAGRRRIDGGPKLMLPGSQGRDACKAPTALHGKLHAVCIPSTGCACMPLHFNTGGAADPGVPRCMMHGL